MNDYYMNGRRLHKIYNCNNVNAESASTQKKKIFLTFYYLEMCSDEFSIAEWRSHPTTNLHATPFPGRVVGSGFQLEPVYRLVPGLVPWSARMLKHGAPLKSNHVAPFVYVAPVVARQDLQASFHLLTPTQNAHFQETWRFSRSRMREVEKKTRVSVFSNLV